MTPTDKPGEAALLPCPFCGSGIRSVERGSDMQVSLTECQATFVVHCSCGSEGTTALSVDGAIAAWNRRALAAQAAKPGEDEMLRRAEASRHWQGLPKHDRPEVEREFWAWIGSDIARTFSSGGDSNTWLLGAWEVWKHLSMPPRCEDSERLNYLIAEGAFIVWTLRDGSIRQCQIWTQDEDEVHHQPAGESRFFNTEREAIDAAIAAKGKP